MNPSVLAILEQIIIKKCLLNNYPKKDVVFLAIDALFNDPQSRKLVTEAVRTATKDLIFDSAAGIASRGYLFSGMIANQSNVTGEQLIQKVKSQGDAHFVQIDTSTEYSADALQILKGTIQSGKKYLLTDDLIATGGSALAALELIRSCGGQVDALFVMTELVDFDARARLKEAGVELVSLLKFNHADLQKLLLIQKCYNPALPIPISYQLSQHAQAVDAFEQTELQVHLASTSPVKKEATQLVCQGLFDPLAIELIEHEAESHVSKQPRGYEETKQGAINRLAGMISSNASSSIAVSMENGLRYSEEEGCYYDFVHVVVKLGDKTIHHTQDCCKVPTDLIEKVNHAEQETWGEAAKRLGLAQLANDPHQEKLFGGVSRAEHLFQALTLALGALKPELMNHKTVPMEEVNAWVSLNEARGLSSFAKRGIFFKGPHTSPIMPSIDLYNHGCSETWSSKTAAKTEFKIFSTGDAFSILAPDIKIKNAPITIHVGLDHPQYSPLVLIHEALQLCRNAYEHGAGTISIALPEQFHPIMHHNDFNLLLLRLFKASGAHKVYFYDKNYNGTLENTKTHYQISSEALANSFQATSKLSLDAQMMQNMRASYLERACIKFGVTYEHSPVPFSPEIKELSHILLCGSSNKALAPKIAASMLARGERVKIYDIEGKGEQAVIPEEVKICGATVTIVQSTRPSSDDLSESQEYQTNGNSAYFFETLMIARQAHLRGAAEINLINPYQFNARSDKAESNAKGKTGAYVQHNGDLLKAAGVTKLVTSECHDPHTLSGTYTAKSMQSSAVPALTVIAKQVALDWLKDSKQGQLRLVTPDAGATKRTNELTNKLQSILGKKLCASRVLGEKQRASHEDDSALIKTMNSGGVGINAADKYLITDDETATGTTLCQAITNLKKSGAQDIAVIVVHNNMPLDWLQRQLCLARFLYLGVNDLHFSDSQEMGALAKSYEDMIQTYAQKTHLSQEEVEAQALAWFKANLSDSGEIAADFSTFKSMFAQFDARIRVHSLADKFASRVLIPAVELPMKIASNDGMGFFSSKVSAEESSSVQQSYAMQ
jgi:adenine phosphoribosyltransferase